MGGKGALFELALALFEEGQEVVLHTPAWVSIPEQIRFAGAAGRRGPDRRAPTVSPSTPSAMLAAITPRTRAVIVNSPCNPTGGTISPGA